MFVFLCYLPILQQAVVYTTANPSVRLSFTLRYSIKMRERRGIRSSPSSSPVSLVFCCQEQLIGDDPVQVKFECKKVRSTPVETAELHTFRLKSETVIDSENSSVNVNRKSNMGFPTNHRPRSCVTSNFPKTGFRYPNLSFIADISTKTIKSLLRSFIV